MAAQHESNNPKVTITKEVSVYPKTQHPPKILNLSNLDRQCPMLMYLVFFYNQSPLSQNLPLSSVFNGLKSGLEETLSVWYPAAGRLNLDPNDGKLNLWCNNEGAVLIEAATQLKISELGDLSQYNDFFENLVYKPIFSANFSDMPLVVGQVTRFGCGGYSVGIGTSHSLFDGPASFDFLRAWASNSAILLFTSEKGSHGHHLQTPVHERPSHLLNIPQNSNTRALAIDHLYHLIQAAMPNNNNDIFGEQLPFLLKTYRLSAAFIENLKKKTIGDEERNGFSCSSFEVLTAHLWKLIDHGTQARTKALGVKKERMVCLQFAVDTRNKMVPSLPKGFSGNAYVLASVSLLARELEERSYEAIIEKIKEAKKTVNGDYVNAYTEALHGAQGALPPLKDLTLVSDWTRMPFHKIDFLHGAAAYASPLVSPIPQVAYFMQNPTDSRGIDVRIGLPPQVMDAFSQYFLMNVVSD